MFYIILCRVRTLDTGADNSSAGAKVKGGNDFDHEETAGSDKTIDK